MKRYALSLVVCLLSILSTNVRAQGPEGKDFGFGLILVEPTGATIKYWTNPVNALVADLGAGGYFGSLRLQVDYLWHFDAFHSTIVKMYAGPGLALGFGAGHEVIINRGHDEFVTTDNGTGVGIRAIFGINVIPRRTPLEMFFELGPLIGITPTGVGLDAGLGIRFYP